MAEPGAAAEGAAGAAAGTFFRYELRTTDVEGARSFYGALLGARAADASLGFAALPENARARGAPAHWLGHVAVLDVEAVADRIVAAGGARLGPPTRRPAGLTRAVLRDPFGAVVAVASRGEAVVAPAEGAVLRHVLNVADPDRAFDLYASTFGWCGRPAAPGGDAGGRRRLFAWTQSGPSVGSVADTARRAGVHPHWLFLFGVDDVERAVGTVRALGGTALPTIRTPDTGAVAVCEDPQGAAFGVCARPNPRS